MEKYGVVSNFEHTKVGEAAVCPQCGRSVDTKYLTPRCPEHGTAPWEKNASKETAQNGNQYNRRNFKPKK